MKYEYKVVHSNVSYTLFFINEFYKPKYKKSAINNVLLYVGGR